MVSPPLRNPMATSWFLDFPTHLKPFLEAFFLMGQWYVAAIGHLSPLTIRLVTYPSVSGKQYFAE